jgi:pyruvate dehydrogenase E1 component alpha subunit
MSGKGQVAVGFFGDGAASEGVLSEVLNIASLWKLPLVLICEHNMYSGISTTASVTAGSIADRARPFGVPAATIDGNDVLAVWRAAKTAVERARLGEGPSFIEAGSYRLRGHIESEAGFLQHKYRTDEEVALWGTRDPIPVFAEILRKRGVLNEAGLSAIEAAVRAQVAEAVAFAVASDVPDMSAVRSAIIGDAGV